MNVWAAFVADGETAEPVKPSEGAFHDPAVFAQALLRLDSASRDAGLDSSLAT